MKLLTYKAGNKVCIGILSRDGVWVYPLKSLGMDYQTMLEVIEGTGESELQLLEYSSGFEPHKVVGAATLPEVTLMAPIPVPGQDIICLGINYMDHAAESAKFKKQAFDGERPYAVYFSKRVSETTGDGEGIPLHGDIVDSLDYEVELAVILGKDARDVKPEDVRNYIFGYTIMNDVSARNLQSRHNQWYFGKSLDGFAPMGPVIVTADSLPYPPELNIWSKVNGELRQSSNTANLIFDIDHIVSELSRGMTLKAGTIISTGTPAGVGMGFEPPRFLAVGDEVECGIDGIGEIRNRVI